MENIIDYVNEYETTSFREMGIRDVDFLILSQCAYWRMDNLIPGIKDDKVGVTIRALYSHPGLPGIFQKKWFEDENRRLIDAMACSKRFQNIVLNDYISIYDKARETQFCALTAMIPDVGCCVIFRGTDESVVGWKEDFNMLFLEQIPGQEFARTYLRQIADKVSQRLFVLGHSKGGNFAMYAVANANQDVQKRVVRVYSFDGPGLTGRYEKKCQRIKGKTRKIVPESSIIGMYNNKQFPCRVVASKKHGFIQHNPFLWEVRDGRFVPVKKPIHREAIKRLNAKIDRMDKEEKRKMVNKVYHLILLSGHDNFFDMVEGKKQSFVRFISGFWGERKVADK